MRMFCHGYQSWSESSWRTVGVDEDPSRAPGALAAMIDAHSGTPTPAAPGELRSHLVTRFDDEPVVHAGPGLLRYVEGELRGATASFDSLEHWARAQPGRVGSPFQVGWCSWYQFFDRVTEDDIRRNLALSDRWPFDVFQIDDGFQRAIGDWLGTNEKFPSPLERLANDIAAAGRRPGLWLAPFLVAPASDLATSHPQWRVRDERGDLVVGMVNEHWGGAVHVLDTTNPEVLDHLEGLTRELVSAGFTYLKLDFTYAAGMAGVHADPGASATERVRAGFEAVRRGAGDETFLLGCGAPLGPAIGLVDGMRIGPDVAPWWELPADRWSPPGYEATMPSTANALRAVRARQFMHRRLWLNDPDCVMLRTTDTQLSEREVRQWAMAVGESGGMVLVSDDLALLGPDAHVLLDEVIDRGREADARAASLSSPP
jgi:alpha-galactosidase